MEDPNLYRQFTPGWSGCAWRVRRAINGQTFLAYVEQVLVPAPRAGEIVIMNNMAFHKVTGVRLVIDGWQSTSLPFRQRCV